MTFLGKCQVMKRSNYQQIIDRNKRQGSIRRLGVELAYGIEVLMSEGQALPVVLRRLPSSFSSALLQL